MHDTDNTLEESLITMDLADRLRHHEQKMATATDLDVPRDQLRTKIRRFYANQGQDIDDRIIDQAIEQRISQRLVHTPPMGTRRQLAESVLTLAQSSTRVILALVIAISTVVGLTWGLADTLFFLF